MAGRYVSRGWVVLKGGEDLIDGRCCPAPGRAGGEGRGIEPLGPTGYFFWATGGWKLARKHWQRATDDTSPKRQRVSGWSPPECIPLAFGWSRSSEVEIEPDDGAVDSPSGELEEHQENHLLAAAQAVVVVSAAGPLELHV